MKKETLDEAIHDNFEMLNCSSYNDFKDGFNAGAAWVTARRFSQQDIIRAFNEGQKLCADGNICKGEYWFKEVGKKWFARLILIIIPFISTAQHRPHYWQKQGFNTALAMYAGFTRHERDVIREKYKAYQAVWPKANPQWSNPQLSRYNKYKNGNVAEGRVKLLGVNKPVFLTDKYHLSTTLIRTSYAGIVGLNMSLYERPKVKHILLQCLVTFAADCAGNGISTLIYKY